MFWQNNSLSLHPTTLKAFKFPDSMEVHFQCTIQICRYQCPDQCDSGKQQQQQQQTGQPSYGGGSASSANTDSYGSPQAAPVQSQVRHI